MTDKEKIHQILSSLWKSGDNSVGKTYYNQALQDVQTAIDLQEEPISEELEKKNKIEILADIIFNAAKHGYMPYDTQDEYCAMEIARKNIDKFIAPKKQEEPVSKDLGEYINELSKQFPEVSFAKLSRIAVRVAKWQKEQMMAKVINAQCFGFQGAALFSFRLPADNYLVGSEVKVIVVNYE